jgi:hypothetical protein
MKAILTIALPDLDARFIDRSNPIGGIGPRSIPAWSGFKAQHETIEVTMDAK